MVQVREKPKPEQKSSVILTPQLRDLYKIVNNKLASDLDRKQALAKINEISSYEGYEPKPKQIEKCVVCGSEFTPKNSRQTRCGSKECEKAFAKKRDLEKSEQKDKETFGSGKIWSLDMEKWVWHKEKRGD